MGRARHKYRVSYGDGTAHRMDGELRDIVISEGMEGKGRGREESDEWLARGSDRRA